MVRKSLLCLLVVALATMPALAASKPRVLETSTRLASLLSDVQTKSTVNEATWRVIANEANALANKVYGYTSGNSTARAAARELRMHVREMRKSALAGDAEGARKHAAEALPFAYKLIDWAT